LPCTRDEIDADAFVVAAHGRDSLLQLLQELEKGEKASLDSIANLALPDRSGVFTFTHRSPESIDFDRDFTRWDLLDEPPVRYSIRTSIGCQYRCGFCDFCYLYPKIRFRSYESLRTELETIKKVRAASRRRRSLVLQLTDDNVFITPRRVDAVCDALLDSELGLRWASFVRASSVNETNIEKIKRSGFYQAAIGVESGDQTILDNMQKQQRVDAVKRGIECLDAADIASVMTFVVGYPGECDATITSTIELLETLRVQRSAYQLYPLNLFPLSALSRPELRQQWQVRGYWDRWSHKTMDRAGSIRCCHRVFESVANVHYLYYDESELFNRKFTPQEHRTLLELRRQLTLQVLGEATDEKVGRTMAAIAATMGFPEIVPPASIAKRIFTSASTALYA
jgi:radical SAM superfamily enzyme YgiQ (UPF0313 family)